MSAPGGSSLGSLVAGWAPGPLEVTEVIDPAPARALAGLLDQPSPVEGPGATLPPGWQALHFLERPAQAELGEDGHPRDGHFLPPIPDRRRMFAGGRWQIDRPLPVGAAVTRRSELGRVEAKSGRSGELLFVTVHHRFRTADGTPLATEDQDLVYRQGPSGPPATSPRPAAPDPGSDPAEEATPEEAAPIGPGWRAELATDPTVLFRFSALTYNSHRIHYDAPYATGVEGYPGLVVHGPLLALLLLELPRRFAPERPVRACTYRLARPAFAGPAVVATGDPATGELEARSGDGAASATATVTLP